MHILILIRIVLDILYLYIQLKITLYIQYHRQVKFQKIQHDIISYRIKHNSHLISFSPHLSRQQFAFIHNTMFNSKLRIQLVPITFVLLPNTRVLTIVLSSNACHSTYKWVTWYLLKNILSHKQSRTSDIKMNCLSWTISTWYKQTVHNTNMYKLEIIA